jgi:threonine dehydratase
MGQISVISRQGLGKMGLPVYEDVVAAGKRLAGVVVKTPVLESNWLNEKAGGRVFIKPECLQHTGSFKFRGAWNFISQLDGADYPDGVVAFSSGNHAQGVAAAAAQRGLAAKIVMPADSPAIKLANTRAYGAEIVTYDRQNEDRMAVARVQLEGKQAILIPPFEHHYILAGQGTVALEIADWGEESGIEFDQLLVPTGGGGLVGGCGLVFAKRFPRAKVHPVEPAEFDDYGRSLIAGEVKTNSKLSGSICDALLTPSSGQMTFAVNRQNLSAGIGVSDDEVAEAVAFAFERLKLVVEPGGAVALAAVLAGKLNCKNKQTAIVLSGGNVDDRLFGQILAGQKTGG